MTHLSTEPETAAELLPAKDRFQFLFGQASELAKALPTYQFQFSAALVIVLGWLLTSEGASKFIQHNPSVSRAGSIVLVVCLVCFHSLWVSKHVQRANRVHEALATCARTSFPDSEALIDSVRIDPFLPWSYVIVNALMCGAILLVCWGLSGGNGAA